MASRRPSGTKQHDREARTSSAQTPEMHSAEGRTAAPAGLPLSTLLSQALVAFTIELDNEFERRMPHWTTNRGAKSGSREGPWLVSAVMWSNCMQFVGDEGLRVRELEQLARTPTNLNGMERWGYVVVEPDAAHSARKPPRSEWFVRATSKGRQAQEVWRPLFAIIEERWTSRFGKKEIERLRNSLLALIGQMDFELPGCLPILGYGLFCKGRVQMKPAPAGRDRSGDSLLHLSALLSKVLLALALEFERESELSLAICANVVRVLDEKGARVRDLPALSGVSKEAVNVAMGLLRKLRVAVVEAEQAGSRVKVARLTAKGREAKNASRRLLSMVEERWITRYGAAAIRALRESLERLVSEPIGQSSPLFRGLEPYPDGWRASVPKPETLPHFPMVLHRGGFPDGS